jgi:hypothetical protein
MSIIKSIIIYTPDGTEQEISYRTLLELSSKASADYDVVSILDEIQDLLFAPFAELNFHDQHETTQ